MHLERTPTVPTDAAAGPWTRGLTRYHWFVFTVPALTALLNTAPTDPAIEEFGGYVTMIFMMGWALGGLGFGILGDRIGRARTMMLTILVYSLFTGLSALSFSV